ncbi:hypothetical protein PR202_gb07431 [Eleusine coracana subsp. coracana]|uniref:Fe2OG dioxygenase domain-containing protein n=1 Tax=Eleusine coracana subsp. coracana TaxID=191504 RepID=A0AAV5EBJ1_ELECO|nr:hypothetical protein PR202_gb07431 [Eleusine coracana subsp. coracana]
MTFLLHVNDVDGLQIKKDGKWFPVQSISGALVINIGDILEIVTNGKYKSIEHRAVINPDKERISSAAFHGANKSCTISPLQELLKEGKARYKVIDAGEYLKGYFAAKLEGRSKAISNLQEKEIAMAHARTTGSLPVGNVQELAQSKRSDEQVPERYIRPEAHTEEVISGYDSTFVIPIIDLSKLCDPQSSHEELVRLGSACQQWGFFQLINHGVPEEVISDLKKNISDFFKLPLEAKKAYSQLPNSLEGYGQVFVVSEEQKLDWADMFYLVLRPNESRDMRFWPACPPSFRTSIDRYSTETAKVARCLLEFMAKHLGVEPELLLEMFHGQPQGLRMNYYPPCRQANKVLGMSPHTDAACLTLLLQVNDVPGLQIRKDGKWLALDALEGAFIVNVGDVLEIVSNGKYKSVEHRAMVHPNRERISVAVFHRPCQDALIGPLPELVKNDGGKARYSSVGYLDFMKRYYSAKLDGRNHLESLRHEL